MKLVPCLCALLVLALAPWATAEEAKVETILSGLSNPAGVAVQPGTGHVFVSDSAAGRIVKVDPKNPGKAEDVVTGFGKDVYGKGPMYDIGPLGLAFLDAKTLVVGGGDHPDGSELVYIFDVSGGKPQTADQAKFKVGPIGPSDDSPMGEGNFYGVAVGEGAVFLTSNGDDTKGWVVRFEWKDGKPGPLKPFIATKPLVEVDAPVGITINHRGLIVVGQMGEINLPKDSLLTFYAPKSGKLVRKDKTDLYDIAGLAYSKEGRLYAVDFAWMATDQGGLFRLEDDGQGGVKAAKITALDKPSAIAAGADGSLYVTVFGTAKEGSDEKPGTLVRITGAP